MANSNNVPSHQLIRYQISTMCNFGNRSDHKPFGEVGVPAINLIHYDWNDYHTPYDTFDKVDFNRTKKVDELILYYLAHCAY